MTSGALMGKVYGQAGFTVVDVGGLNVNGSLRADLESQGLKYICVDMEAHPSVDIVVKPGEKLPFETGTIDMVVSTSCFEHDPCFWITFKELCRIVKVGGYIYVNAPANGLYHKFPGDNWRFYSDAGQALAYWAGYKMYEAEITYPVSVVETFHILPVNAVWIDFVCVWKRGEKVETEIVLSSTIKDTMTPLKNELCVAGLKPFNMSE
jgi:SAM-dependent methyltransferase